MENQTPIELLLAIILMGYTQMLFELGFLATVLFYRMGVKKERYAWKTWGVEEVFLLDKVSFWVLSIGCVALTVIYGWLFLSDVSTTVDVIAATYTNPESVGLLERYMFGIAPYCIPILGFAMYQVRINATQAKLSAVTRLRPIFRERLGVTVISAVYEYSRQAPESFWQDFANWTDAEISPEAARHHIEWALPYSASKSLSMAAWALIIAIGAVLVPIALFIIGADFSFSGLP